MEASRDTHVPVVSVIYLPLAEATVLTFLSPLLAAYLLSFFAVTPFTRTQRLAGMLSLFGVIVIAKPLSLFERSSDPSASGTEDHSRDTARNDTAVDFSKQASRLHAQVTSSQRAVAIGVALVGVLGAAGAYATLTCIGKRAHSLVSVTYFSACCMVISTIALVVVPGVDFRLPAGTHEWLFTAALGLFGFSNQFMLTSALAVQKVKGRVLNFVYTQMLFAIGLDRWVFGTQPGWTSVVGSTLILGSSIWVAVKRDEDSPERHRRGGDEASFRLIEGQDHVAARRPATPVYQR